MKKIVNIVNFVRACEPRDATVDLVGTLKNEISLNKKYGFPNTILMQYDAMITPEFQNIFKTEKDDNTELGIWFECVRQLVEECGIKWRGPEDVTWDWHIIPGFLMAYSIHERKAMIDEFMTKFKEIFGYYPASVGSWLLDSWSVNYMEEAYDVKAFVICREQYGVDAYTVWGGYYNQGYYPAKNNIMCPAQTKENAVNAPVFKMLGPDPIYCYDEEEFETGIDRGCATMEPIWKYGNNKKIFTSYLDSYYKEECMDFAYSTVGQENPFGWNNFGDALMMQMEIINERSMAGEFVIEKLCDTGEWFKNTFTNNPQVSLISHDDWADNGLKSVWFNCKNYRANLFVDNTKLYFRDITKFDERYNERYLDVPCTTMTAYYDNLPVVDGRLWNDENIKAGLKFDADISEFNSQKENGILVCRATSDKGEIVVSFHDERICITKPANVKMYFERGVNINTEVFETQINVCEKSVEFIHNNFLYSAEFNTEVIRTDMGYELKGEKIEIYLGNL